MNGEAEVRDVRPGRAVWAVGTMSGTSMDGVDVALLRTDGDVVAEVGPALTLAYDEIFRRRLSAAIADPGDDALVAAVAQQLTERHWTAIGSLVRRWSGDPRSIRVIGFHGHTLWHRPQDGRTRQIGDGALLSRLSAAPVVSDFRSADMAAGGEGAPLVPLYHLARARAAQLDLPVAVLNLGGVANVTWIGPSAANGAPRLLAFDTGPGNALIDDWALAHTGKPCDVDGRLAAAGRVDAMRLAQFLAGPYFARRPPKSLDRNEFTVDLSGLSPADGAATLTAFTAEAVALGTRHFPQPARRFLATGGGRHNPVLLAGLSRALGVPVSPVEDVGWNGDALEAEAFAYLAVRSLRGLALSLPETTGARAAVTGGRLDLPPTAAAGKV
ncbi:MAG: anhydro-N-acetylmuramic acid kinase [Pseudomonadota bacterium]